MGIFKRTSSTFKKVREKQNEKIRLKSEEETIRRQTQIWMFSEFGEHMDSVMQHIYGLPSAGWFREQKRAKDFFSDEDRYGRQSFLGFPTPQDLVGHKNAESWFQEKREEERKKERKYYQNIIDTSLGERLLESGAGLCGYHLKVLRDVVENSESKHLVYEEFKNYPAGLEEGIMLFCFAHFLFSTGRCLTQQFDRETADFVVDGLKKKFRQTAEEWDRFEALHLNSNLKEF